MITSNTKGRTYNTPVALEGGYTKKLKTRGILSLAEVTYTTSNCVTGGGCKISLARKTDKALTDS